VSIDLKSERLNRGLSLDALAEKTGVPKSTLARAENDGPQPTASNAFAIADFYGYKVTEIWPVDRQPKAEAPAA
jgi:transcriptional regulator with XRE-family HTH domain